LATEKSYLFFVCPVTGLIARTNGGKGFKINTLKEAFTHVAPAARLLIGILKVSITSLIIASCLGPAGSFVAGLLPETMNDSDTYAFETLESLSALARASVGVIIEDTHLDDDVDIDFERMDKWAANLEPSSIAVGKPCVVSGSEYKHLVDLVQLANDQGSAHVSWFGGGQLHDTGLVPVVPKKGGRLMWVHPSAVQRYRDEGEKCLLPEVRRRLEL